MSCTFSCIPPFESWIPPFDVESADAAMQSLLSKIAYVAKSSFEFIGTMLFFGAFCYYHAPLFTMGFFVSVFLTEFVEARVDRINLLFKECGASQITLVALGIFTYPVTAPIISAWAGAKCGLYFIKN